MLGGRKVAAWYATGSRRVWLKCVQIWRAGERMYVFMYVFVLGEFGV